jgi:hypothetical protein
VFVICETVGGLRTWGVCWPWRPGAVLERGGELFCWRCVESVGGIRRKGKGNWKGERGEKGGWIEQWGGEGGEGCDERGIES